MTVFGYARCSTDGQDLSGQIEALRSAGCERVYHEKVSGARIDRRELDRLIRRLRAGDHVMVTRLDRLARSTRDLLHVLEAIGKAGASFRSIHDRWADTSTPHGRLILVVLGGLAEYERELILARTAEGMVRARERGVKFGRPRALSHFQRQEAVQRLRNGESQSDIARSYGVSAPTISRLRATSAV